MEAKGYSNYTTHFGIRREHNRNKMYNFCDPEKMLKDFLKYINERQNTQA